MHKEGDGEEMKPYIAKFNCREVLIGTQKIQAENLVHAEEIAQHIAPSSIRLLWEPKEFSWELIEIVEDKKGEKKQIEQCVMDETENCCNKE